MNEISNKEVIDELRVENEKLKLRIKELEQELFDIYETEELKAFNDM